MKPFKDFKFNKAFGQNFLADTNLLNAIVSDSGISFNDSVLEIGTGAGALTTAISKVAKKVVTFEIDKKLTEYLTEKFAEVKNVQLVFGDALKTPIQEIENLLDNKNFHIVANIPYYITTPLIFKFLEETSFVKSFTLMVQKEVAEKVVAKVGEKNYGVLSVVLQYYCTCKIKRIVSKKMFSPVPKVDSAVLHLERKENVPFEKDFSKFIAGLFAMKRKTINNNLLQMGYERSDIENALASLNISPLTRAETLNCNTIRQLYTKLVQIQSK